jgi:hypothetical protein
MPFSLPHIILSLLASTLAVAGLNLAFPVEIARSVTGVPFAALLANLPGTAGAARGLPVLTICRLQWAIVCQAVFDIAYRRVSQNPRRGWLQRYATRSVQPILSRMKATPRDANAARSLLSLP